MLSKKQTDQLPEEPEELTSEPMAALLEQTEEEIELDMVDQAKEVLNGNDHGSFTMPSTRLYPHQWLWDSCFIAIGIRDYDVDRAKIEILSLLRAQWANGMIPHMIITPPHNIPAKAYDHPGKIWRSWLNPNAPNDIATSGITQPPMIAEAVIRIGERMKLPERRSWYKMVYQPLLEYHQ